MIMPLAIIVIIAVATVGAYYATRPAAPVTPEPSEKVKVVILMAGVWNDMGWHTGMYQRALELAEELDIDVVIDDGLRYTVGEYTADPAIIEWSERGYDIIIGHGFGLMFPILRVAPDYPDIWYLHSAGEGFATNVASYVMSQWDGGYLAGIVAGSITQTNKIGFIAGQEIPDCTALAEMFLAGAYRVNPDIELTRTYLATWDDATKGREAAIAMMDAGVDVIIGRGGEMELGVIQAVAARDAESEDENFWMIGDILDQHALASGVVITSNVVDWGVPLIKILEMYRAGTLEPEWYTWGIKDGAAGLAPFYEHENVISQETKDLLAEVEADIMSGDLVIPFLGEELPFPWSHEEVPTVTLSGTVTYADWTVGDMVVEVRIADPVPLWPDADYSATFDEMGAWSIEVPANLGEVWITGFNDEDGDGQHTWSTDPQEPTGMYAENPVTVGATDVSGLDFTLEVAVEEEVTLSGTVDYPDWTAGGMVIEVYVGADPVPQWPDANYSATFDEMGAWSIEVPADLGEVWIAGFNDEDGDGVHGWWLVPTEPTGFYAENPVTVGATDISGLDFTLAPE